jgi:hypothetical protein
MAFFLSLSLSLSKSSTGRSGFFEFERRIEEKQNRYLSSPNWVILQLVYVVWKRDIMGQRFDLIDAFCVL